MISHGDELGRTQHGNNNGYAQDNELTWIDWEAADLPLVEFTASVARLRREHPTFRRSRFFDGRPGRSDDDRIPDVVWLRPDGRPMAPEDWDSGFGRSVGMFLNGQGIRENDSRGRPVTDVNFLVYFNSGDEPIDLVIPDERHGAQWRIVVDTAGELAADRALEPGDGIPLDCKATLVLQEIDGVPEAADHSVDASLRAQSGQAAS